jgi:uncharacterized protein YcbK (DUF882 family)
LRAALPDELFERLDPYPGARLLGVASVLRLQISGSGKKGIAVMIDRRRLLFSPAAAAFSLFAPPSLGATGFPSHRWVKILFVPTGERFDNLYCSDGAYLMPAVQQFSWTCRDYRVGQWKWLHPWLMDLVFVLHWRYNKDEIRILSGYRRCRPGCGWN